MNQLSIYNYKKLSSIYEYLVFVYNALVHN